MAWWQRQKAATATSVDSGDLPDAPGKPLIRLQGITKLFKGDADEETRALSNVTVDIGRGEYVSVSGPSGCGKSTFLAILALLESPTTGHYWLNGRAIERLSPSERARVRNIDIGLIFQSFNLIGDMTVYENVEYPLTLRGVSPADRRRRSKARSSASAFPRARSSGRDTSRAAISSSSRSRAPCRAAADPARRRADRQPRLEERRGPDADARRAARRRRNRVPRDAQSALHRAGRAAHLHVRWSVRRSAHRVKRRRSKTSNLGLRLRRSCRAPARVRSPRGAPASSCRSP